jgi:hypothetical protein
MFPAYDEDRFAPIVRKLLFAGRKRDTFDVGGCVI